jgi:uncharacterized protein (TIGR02466 family)
MSLNLPARYRGPEEFLEPLRDQVATHPTLTWEPHGKTTRAGSQTARLVEADAEVFADFVAALRAAIDAFLARLPVMADHPHFFRIPTEYRLSIWATVLVEGGHQLPHIHPSGWLSGVYYVAVPESISDGDPDQAGWFEIGRPGDDLALTRPPDARAIKPEAGALLLFPSYYFHRTVPFRGDQARISIAFDVEPLAFRS